MSVMEGRTTSALLYLDGVHVSFDGFHAINNLSLTLEPGEMRAIIGPNGAGKTTMMDIITGKTKPDEGTVLFDGMTDLTRLDETRIAELGIGRKFPEADGVREPDHRGQSAAGAQRRSQRQGHAVLARQPGRSRADRPRAGNHPPDRCAQPIGRKPVARPEAVARDRHAAGAGPKAAAWSTSRSPG
jgi:ABC-type branched-subunit amino acid transport system ATPase component